MPSISRSENWYWRNGACRIESEEIGSAVCPHRFSNTEVTEIAQNLGGRNVFKFEEWVR